MNLNGFSFAISTSLPCRAFGPNRYAPPNLTRTTKQILFWEYARRGNPSPGRWAMELTYCPAKAASSAVEVHPQDQGVGRRNGPSRESRLSASRRECSPGVCVTEVCPQLEISKHHAHICAL